MQTCIIVIIPSKNPKESTRRANKVMKRFQIFAVPNFVYSEQVRLKRFKFIAGIFRKVIVK